MLEGLRDLLTFGWGKKTPETFGEYWKLHGQDLMAMQDQVLKIRKKQISLVSASDEAQVLGIEKGRSEFNYANEYAVNAWVHISVRTIASACAMLDLKAYRPKVGKKGSLILDEVQDGLAVELFKKPSLHTNTHELKLFLFGSLMYAGNSYLYVDDKNGELWNLLPQNTFIIAKRLDFINHYNFRLNDWSVNYDIKPENMVHAKEFNPNSYFYGQSRLSAAYQQARLMESDNSFWTTFWKSGGRVLGAWSTDSKLSEPQYERFQKTIQNKYKGMQNMFRDMLLEQGLKYTQLGVTQQDAQIMDKYKINREEILSVYGIPPGLVGILDHSNYSNMEVQEKIFWEITCLPIIKIMEEALNSNPLLSENGSIVFKFDTSKVEVLQSNNKSKAEIGQTLIGSSQMTPNEVRERYWSLDPLPGGDELKPLQGNTFSIAPGKEAEDLKKKDDSETVVNKPRKPRFNKISQEKKDQMGKTFDQELKKHDDEVISIVRSRFKKQSEVVLAHIRTMIRDGVEKVSLDDKRKLTMGLEDGRSEYETIMRERLHVVANFFASAAVDDLKSQVSKSSRNVVRKDKPKVIDWNPKDAKVSEFIFNRTADVAKIVDDGTLQYFYDGIEAQLLDDASLPAVAGFVSEFFGGMETWRALRIARTETGAIASFAMNETFKANADIIDQKEWINAGDNEVRDSHQDVDPVGVDEKFILGSGNETESAPARTGEAADDINCRCTMAAIVKQSDGGE